MKKALILILGVSLLALAGCIVSGTFVFTDSFELTIASGFSHDWVDITDESDWEDAKDDIDRIESIGLEVWFDNQSANSLTFDVYVSDPPEGAALNTTTVLTEGTLVIDDFTVPVGESHMSYANSFDFIQNVDKLKELAEGGQFHVYGIQGGSGTLVVDSAKVIITLNASATP